MITLCTIWVHWSRLRLSVCRPQQVGARATIVSFLLSPSSEYAHWAAHALYCIRESVTLCLVPCAVSSYNKDCSPSAADTEFIHLSPHVHLVIMSGMGETSWATNMDVPLPEIGVTVLSFSSTESSSDLPYPLETSQSCCIILLLSALWHVVITFHLPSHCHTCCILW
jgi:hypothetical protein